MEIKSAFGKALRVIRTKKNMSQESFSLISSRTYLSTLERGMKSPTLDKIDVISKAMGIHPLTLLTKTYIELEQHKSAESLLEIIETELEELK